jgi:biotin synthase-like enzyme
MYMQIKTETSAGKVQMDGRRAVTMGGLSQNNPLKRAGIWIINIEQDSAAQQRQEIIIKTEHHQDRHIRVHQ